MTEDRSVRPAEDGQIATPPCARFRWLWLVVGGVLTALGFIGAVLPLMPSTIFFIGAVACFARSSPQLEAWLLSFGFISGPVQDWRERGAISRNGKWLATIGMACGLSVLAVARPNALVLAIGAIFIAASAAFVWTRPD